MPERLTALASVYREGDHGARNADGAGVVFTERRNLAMAQVSAFPPDVEVVAKTLKDQLGIDLPLQPGTSTSGEHVVTLWQAPERWLLIESGGKQGLAQALAEALAGFDSVAVTDLGHSRTVLRLSGPRVRELLSKGCSLDFHPEAFPVGRCATSAFGHLAVLIHAVAEDSFDISSLRSFGQALWEDLTDQAEEYGYRVVSPQ